MRLAFITSDAASVTVMKKRVAAGSVTSTGSRWRMRSRITSTKLPLLASTLPKRTTIGRVTESALARAASSAKRFVAPITLRRRRRFVGRDENEPGADFPGGGQNRQRAKHVDA